MSYNYTFNRDYTHLAHFNKNHSKANGQFIEGDGDDDGIVDDHHNYSRNKKDLAPKTSYVHPADIKDIAESLGSIARTGGLLYLTYSESRTASVINKVAGAFINDSDIISSARNVGIPQLVNRYKNIAYIKIANAMNGVK